MTESDVLLCARCGRPLDGDPDEDRFGYVEGPVCGECIREINFIDFEVEVQEAERDDEIDD